MDAAEALGLIQSADQWDWRDHALKRMNERDASRADVKHAVRTATACEASTTNPGAWVVTGTDRTGDPLRVSIAIERILPRGVRNVVVTVMDI